LYYYPNTKNPWNEWTWTEHWTASFREQPLTATWLVCHKLKS